MVCAVFTGNNRSYCFLFYSSLLYNKNVRLFFEEVAYRLFGARAFIVQYNSRLLKQRNKVLLFVLKLIIIIQNICPINYSYTALETTNIGKTHIPFTNGLEARVIYGGLVAGTMRLVWAFYLKNPKIF